MTSRRKVLLGGVGALALGAGGLAGRRWFLSREPEARPAIDGQGRVLWSNWAGNAHSYPATAQRTSTDTLTRSDCARATSAAFKPRISTVTKSWAVVFIGRRMEGREALVKPAAGRLSLHSP